MGIFSAWRHHLQNEANRRIIAANPRQRAERQAPVRVVTPSEERAAGLLSARRSLDGARDRGDDRMVGYYERKVAELEASTTAARRQQAVDDALRHAEHSEAMGYAKAAAGSRQTAARYEAMTDGEYEQWEAKVARTAARMAGRSQRA